MFTSIRQHIGPPPFADEEQNRVARTLFTIQLMLLVAAGLAMLIAVFSHETYIVVGLLAGGLATGVTLWLSHRGYIRSGSFGVTLILLGLGAFLLLSGQGVHGIAITLYPTMIIVASLLLERRAFLIAIALMLVSLGLVVYAEIQGWLGTAYPSLTSWSDFAMLAVILILAAVTVRFLADGLILNLQRARRNEQALAISNAQLQREAARLEILVDIDRAILNAQTLDSIALAVLERMRSLVPARYAALVLFDFPRNRHEAFVIKTDRGVEIFREWRPLEYFEIMEPLRHSRPHVVADIQALPQRTPMEEQMLAEGTRAYIDAPLQAQGELIGALSFEAVEAAAYDPDRVKMIQHVADHLAIAVSAARLFEAEQKQAALMTALHEVALNVNAHLDLPALLQTIVAQAAQLIQAEMGSLFLLQPDDQTLLEVCRYNLPEADTFTHMQLGEGLSGLVALTGDALAVDDYQHWPLRHSHAAELPYRSALAAPIKWKDRVLGTITILDTRPGRFSANDLRAVDALAAQAAVAVENARLYAEAQERAAQLAMMNEIGHAVSALQDLDNVLEVIYRQVQKITPVDAFYISLYDPESKQVSFPIMYDMGVRYNESTALLKQDSRLAQVIHTGGPSKLHRTLEEIQSVHDRGLGNLQRRSASLLLVPLWAAEQVIGALSIQSYTLNAYTDEHVKILTGIAHQAAIAIENARLYSAVQQELVERQRIEAQLRESEERYRLISEVISDYTFSTALDAQGVLRLTWVAGAFETITGYSFDEYVARGGWLAALHPDDVAQDAQDMAALRTNQPVITEVRTICKSGAVRWVRVYAHPVWDETANRLVGIYGAVQDVTERKRAEAALLQSKAISAAVAYSARQLLEAADWRTQIQAVLAQLGQASQATHVYVFENHQRADGALLTSQRYESVRPGFRPEIDDPRLQNVKVSQPDLDDWYGPLMRGEPFYSSSQGFSEHWSNSLTARGIKTLLDVPIFVAGRWWGIIGFDDCVNELAWSQVEIDALRTAAGLLGAAIQRQKADEERETLIADLEAKNAELERFTYTVSHDLKSPLITIRGFLGFLERDARAGNLDRLQADVQRISDATDKMRRLLDDLLELSRIGRLMNPPATVPLAAIVQEAITLVQGRIEACGVQAAVAADLPVVSGDYVRLVEVVQNLIDNACKFMGSQPEPRITIGQSGTDRDGRPIVFVRDNGSGIDAQYQEKVFGLFDKLDPQSEGTGIGLTLVKRIVEVHGGRIWVESQGLGQGATFFFTLPTAPE